VTARSSTREASGFCTNIATVGIDGGGLDDLLGIAVIGREKNTRRWILWTHAFISPEGEERRKANATVYQQFMDDGDLTRVEQLPDDLAAIVEIVRLVKVSRKLAAVGVDRIGIGGIVDALAEIKLLQPGSFADPRSSNSSNAAGIVSAASIHHDRRLRYGSSADQESRVVQFGTTADRQQHAINLASGCADGSPV
jgi:hypothetical protein